MPPRSRHCGFPTFWHSLCGVKRTCWRCCLSLNVVRLIPHWAPQFLGSFVGYKCFPVPEHKKSTQQVCMVWYGMVWCGMAWHGIVCIYVRIYVCAYLYIFFIQDSWILNLYLCVRAQNKMFIQISLFNLLIRPKLLYQTSCYTLLAFIKITFYQARPWWTVFNIVMAKSNVHHFHWPRAPSRNTGAFPVNN